MEYFYENLMRRIAREMTDPQERKAFLFFCKEAMKDRVFLEHIDLIYHQGPAILSYLKARDKYITGFEMMMNRKPSVYTLANHGFGPGFEAGIRLDETCRFIRGKVLIHEA